MRGGRFPKRAPDANPGTQRMWTAMRVHRRFELRDLVLTAAVKLSWVAQWVRWLRHCDYVRIDVHARGSKPAVFRLVRDTGQLPPLRARDGDAYDQNEKRKYGPKTTNAELRAASAKRPGTKEK